LALVPGDDWEAARWRLGGGFEEDQHEFWTSL
jgi:hypothetical protein